VNVSDYVSVWGSIGECGGEYGCVCCVYVCVGGCMGVVCVCVSVSVYIQITDCTPFFMMTHLHGHNTSRANKHKDIKNICM
jgi:hypothetical protein